MPLCSAPVISHAHEGTTASAFTRVNVAAARRLGLSPDGYVHLLGLAPEHLDGDGYRTPSATNIRIWESATVHAPWTEVAQLVTEESVLGALGVWDYLITSAPTPLDGLRDAAAYLAALGDAGTETLRITEDGADITISHFNEADLTYDAARAIRAYMLGLLQRRLGDAMRSRLVPVRVALAAQAPRRHDALTELYGTEAIDFEVPVSSITFRAAELKAPNPHAQPGLSAVLRRHAEQSLAAAIPLHGWLDHFRSVLAAGHAEGSTQTLASVARRMALSSRTLQRRLDEHGTTWSGEVENLRRASVTRLLQNTDLSVEAVAALSGYADARVLRRAVRRWYGQTPGSLRRAVVP